MNTRLTKIAGTALMSAVLALSSPLAAAADGELRARFELAPGEQWATVTIPMSPEAWHDGKGAVGAGQLRDALRNLRSVEIGARCAGWVEGETSYPCGISLVLLDAAVGTGAGHPVNAFGLGVTPGARQRTAGRSDTPEMRAAGLIAPLPDAAQRVAVTIPAARVDASRPLRFRIRAVFNRLVPSMFERGSGEVVLRGAGENVAAVD